MGNFLGRSSRVERKAAPVVQVRFRPLFHGRSGLDQQVTSDGGVAERVMAPDLDSGEASPPSKHASVGSNPTSTAAPPDLESPS